MVNAESFIQVCKAKGFGLYTGVPCSYLTPFINYVIDSPELRYVIANNEGEAIAIASGAELGGSRSVVMFQNSGLGNAVNPLTSLNHVFHIPILLIVTWRGQATDEPQHKLMGTITPSLLELLQIPWDYFPTEIEKIESTLRRAIDYMEQQHQPYALIMQKGSVEPYALNFLMPPKQLVVDSGMTAQKKRTVFFRNDILQAIQASRQSDDILLATTGYTGRELYTLGDKSNQFYQVGSMGCISSLGLGIALVQPMRRVIAIDGDGAILMRLGALATIGYERPSNLLHILLDNEKYESTGGQATVSHSVDFCAIASACGYERVIFANTLQEIKSIIESPIEKLTFVHVKIKAGVSHKLLRPTITPLEVAQRLRKFIQQTSIQ